MYNLFLAAGVAALAISVPASAEQGQGRGQGQSAKAERGGDGEARSAKANRGKKAQADKAERGKGREARAERGRGQARQSERRAERRQEQRSERRQEARADQRDRDDDRRRVENGRDRDDDRRLVRRDRDDDRRRVEARRDRDDDRRLVLIRRDRDGDRLRIRDIREDRRGRQFAEHRGIPPGLLGGCPPGLAKKTPACVPPGLAKQQFLGQRLPASYSSNRLPDRLRYRYRDNDDHYYRYGDGYLYRVNRQSNLIGALLPLFGAGYGVGQQFPVGSGNYAVPSYYQSFYPNTSDGYYRYANGYMYEIDRRTGRVEDIMPLLGGGYGVGQMLPAGYSAYNVPYQYRSRYMDDDDYYYRYAPGAIYQVDRGSSLITAVASLLTGGLGVGQQLPMGYSAYNVPLGYRDQYYDTQNDWYRYSNNNIYRVDPKTQLITALVRALV